MSGDVQARKRKEKKRKKDEEDNVTPSPTVGSISENLTDNISIHIYKESNTGGHWCARIIFFIVLAVLIGIVGIVIIEHRGTTDINTPLESSRWAFIFDGWVDDSLSLLDEELHGNGHGKIETEEKSTESYNENSEEETAETEVSEDTENEAEDDTLSEYADQEKDLIEDESNEAQDQVFESKEELSHEIEYEDSEQEVDMMEDEQVKSEDFDDADVLEEIYGTSKDKNSDEEDITYETVNHSEEILEMSTNEDVFDKLLDIPGVNKINDDNIEPLEEVESIEPEEYISDVDIKPDVEDIEEESASVPMKFGVGVALVVAAHFVLVKRWNNEKQVASRKEEEKKNKAESKEGINVQLDRFKKADDDIQIEEERDRVRKDEVQNVQGEKHNEKEEEDGEEDEEAIMQDEEEAQEEEDYEEEEDEEVEEEEEEEDEGEEEDEAEEEEEEEEEVEEEEEEEEEKNQEYTEKGKKFQKNQSKRMGMKHKSKIGMEWTKMSEEESEEETDIENIREAELLARLEAKYGKLVTMEDDEDNKHEQEIRRNKKK